VELDWTTFALEVVNFLVLVWLLTRFLYRPVLDLIERRRAAIRQDLAEAEARREEARSLEAQYRTRLDDWEREREAARTALRQELDAERQRQLQTLAGSLDEQRERARVLTEREAHESARRAEEAALELAARFAGRLLSRLAGPELEGRLVDLALEDLAGLPAARHEALREAWHRLDGPVLVTSAFPLDDRRRAAVEHGLTALLGPGPVPCRLETDPELLGGLRVAVGPWVLRGNLRDELELFREASHGPA